MSIQYVILFIVAVVLFVIIVPIFALYTFIYYLFKESQNSSKYFYRIAYTIDVLANVMGGEMFEYIFCIKRTADSLFCKSNVSISEAIGNEIYRNNYNQKYNWFSKLLDKVFFEHNHCLNAYLKNK